MALGIRKFACAQTPSRPLQKILSMDYMEL